MGPQASSGPIPPTDFLPPSDSYALPKDIHLPTLQHGIRSRKIAAFHRPLTEPLPDGTSEQCPICYQYYVGGLNYCIGCKCRLCTDCFIHCAPVYRRFAPPKLDAPPTVVDVHHHYVSSRDERKSKCPFCKTRPFRADFSGPLPERERRKLLAEQQKVIQLRAQQQASAEEESRKRRETRLSQQVAEFEAAGGKLSLESDSDGESDEDDLPNPMEGVMSPDEIRQKARSGDLNEEEADAAMIQFVMAQSEMTHFEEERRRRRRKRQEKQRLRRLLREKRRREEETSAASAVPVSPISTRSEDEFPEVREVTASLEGFPGDDEADETTSFLLSMEDDRNIESPAAEPILSITTSQEDGERNGDSLDEDDDWFAMSEL